jgi:hypothetical protein
MVFGTGSREAVMFRLRWSVRSPLPASALADRVRAEPRWNGWRDGFADGRFLVAEQPPVEVGPDGFRFVVPSSPRMCVLCSGRFYPAEGGTRVELRATLPPVMAVAVTVSAVLVVAAFAIGLWAVSPRLAIGGAVASFTPVVLLMALLFWWDARRVRRRVTELLTRPDTGAAGGDGGVGR